MRKPTQRWIGIIFGLEFLLVGLMNYITPLYEDDFYMVNNHYSLRAFIDAAKYDYFNWNGRVVGQTLFRGFMNVPLPLFKILNIFMFCLLTFLILLYSSKNWRKLSPVKYLAIIAASWLFLPAFGQTVLWAAGTFNYLWTTVIILSLALPFVVTAFDIQTFSDKTRVNRYVKAILIIFLGVLAGWSNENTSGGLIMALVLMMLYQKFIAKKNWRLWQWTGLIGAIIGFLALITANGNKVRTAATASKSYLQMSLFERLSKGIDTVSDAISSLHMPLVFILLAAAVIMHVLWFENQRAVRAYLWALCGFATLYALALSPTGADGGRAFFGGIVFLLIALFSSIPDNFEISENTTLKVSYLALMAFVVTALFNFYPGFSDMYHANAALKTRYTYIEEMVQKGHTKLKVPPLYYYPKTKYAINYDSQELGKNTKIFPNSGYVHYFKGLKSIVIDNPNAK
ncbi:DUF6056 family protein [Agrilactobacillus yilanensis]|uniref:DUF6056 family protein n=1 Tax=Agrilactobacillus yilanensis TaxID=2485997 RepID=A0ABW4J4Z4_9LACO|nr:DUF6056 family protein [Agrilactobacillus yilanensis]